MNKFFLLVAVVLLAGFGFAGYWFLLRPPAAPVNVPVGAAPDRRTVPVPQVQFKDVTAAAGLTFTHRNGAFGKKLLPETMGPGVAVIDYDADGKPDLLFVSGCPWPGQPAANEPPCLALYRNKGDSTFEDVT